MRSLRAIASHAALPLAVACAALAPLAWYWLGGHTLAWFDTQMLYAPQRWLVDQALRAFRLPLWNPFAGAGMPLFADAIHGVLHPVSLLAAWFHASGPDVLIGAYVACAAVGASLLALALGASRPAAAVAGLSYGASGFVLSMAGNLVFLAGAASVPYCLAGLRRFAGEPAPGAFALGALGVAILAFSGDAQSLAVALAVSLPLAWDAGGWRAMSRALLAASVGLLLAGVQLIPTAVQIPRTLRSAETWSASAGVWALEPWRIPELILPGLLRGQDPFSDPLFRHLAGAGHSPSDAFPMPFAASICVGLVPAALAVVALRQGRRARLLWLLALGMLWVALGPALGSSQILGQIPVWRAFRYSEKLLGPLTLILAVLAALGADVIEERKAGGWQLLGVAVALAGVALVIARAATWGLAPALEGEVSARLGRGSWHLLGALVALGGWLLVRRRVSVPFALAALAWLPAAAAAPLALRPGDPELRLDSPVPDLRAEPPGARIAAPYVNSPLWSPGAPDVSDLRGRYDAALGYPAYNVRARLDSLGQYAAMTPRRLGVIAADDWAHWPLAPRRFAVTHLILDPPLSDAQRALRATVTTGGTLLGMMPGVPFEVWAVPHRPWASFALEVRAVPDEESGLRETARSLLAQDSAAVLEATGPFQTGPGTVLSVERGLEDLRIEAEADRGGTLLVADAWWPGWVATVDGREVPIFPADVLIRAVRWPAGRHVMEMRYRPPEVAVGLLATGIGLMALAWGTWRLRPRPSLP